MKRYLIILIVLTLWVGTLAQNVVRRPIVTGGGGCAGSDAFTGTNGDPISANWTNVSTEGGTSWDIQTNSAHPNATTGIASIWNPCTPTDNQYSEIVVGAPTGGKYIGPILRAQSGVDTGYICKGDTANGVFIQIIVAGVAGTVLDFEAIAIAPSDTLRFEATGSSLTCTFGANTLTATDSTYTSGTVGIYSLGHDSGTTPRIASWAGGDL